MARVKVVDSSHPLRINLDSDDIVRRYLQCESEQAIAKSLGVTRGPIRTRLLRAGIDPRGRSEAATTRMSQTTEEYRKGLASAANAARRHRTIDGSALPISSRYDRMAQSAAIKRRRSRSQIGKGEPELLDLFTARGFSVVPQQDVGRCNLDFAALPVAVEVWWAKSYPFRHPSNVRRTVYLANLGWTSLFVWLARQMPDESTADAVIAYVEGTRCRPLTVSPEYRVIRRNGEMVSTGEAKLDQIALVMPAHRRP